MSFASGPIRNGSTYLHRIRLRYLKPSLPSPRQAPLSTSAILHGPARRKFNSKVENFPHDTLDQGHVLDTMHFSPDPHAAAARAGFEAHATLAFDHPYDAASPRRGTRFKISAEAMRASGNPEGVGFADQVGGQSAAVEVFELGGENHTVVGTTTCRAAADEEDVGTGKRAASAD